MRHVGRAGHIGLGPVRRVGRLRSLDRFDHDRDAKGLLQSIDELRARFVGGVARRLGIADAAREIQQRDDDSDDQ